MKKLSLLLLVYILLLTSAQPVAASQAAEQAVADPQPLIEAATGAATDAAIQTRIANIFQQIETLKSVSVAVNEGVVTLAGATANEAQAQRAFDLAIRVEGVVTVEDRVDRTLDLQDNVTPVLENFKGALRQFQRALPLIGLAILAFFLIGYLGHRLARWSTLWNKVAPNPFLAELLAQAIRIIGIIIGLVVALNFLGATTLMGTILGGAGVVGIALGFAVRDSLENYISSIMLSLRHPFRAGDLVVINDREGIVIRLTSRATILMTTDGNHLRIPNSIVFKAVIINYTRNPERRFTFELGIDSEDDPLAAMNTGLAAIAALDFILKEPKPAAKIESVGDSNIIIWFSAWVNQTATDFGKGRSFAIRAAKNALETGGFTLPEPIYRLRFDQNVGGRINIDRPATSATAKSAEKPKPVATKSDEKAIDVRPDTRLEEMVSEERAQDDSADLLDDDKPIE